MKKIAILTPTFNYYSGIDRVVQKQAEEYSKKGYEVTIVTLESAIKAKKYRIINLGMPKNLVLQRIYRLLFFLDFKKIIYGVGKLKNYDIVISHFYPMNWLAYSAKKRFGSKIRYIYFNHGINRREVGNVFQRVYMELFYLLNGITIKNADDAYSVSRYLANELKKECNIDSRIIYNKIDKNRFNSRIKGDKIIKKYNLGNNKIVLYVGRIAPHKGLHLLLEAFRTVQKNVPNTNLLIVGKPTFNSYFNKIKKMANNSIIFTGFVDDNELPYYYAACDVYATASLWEGFDIPIAEAQACNKPVVAFDIGPHKEIMKNGILAEKNDINGFAKAIIRILTNEN